MSRWRRDAAEPAPSSWFRNDCAEPAEMRQRPPAEATAGSAPRAGAARPEEALPACTSPPARKDAACIARLMQRKRRPGEASCSPKLKDTACACKQGERKRAWRAACGARPCGHVAFLAPCCLLRSNNACAGNFSSRHLATRCTCAYPCTHGTEGRCKRAWQCVCACPLQRASLAFLSSTETVLQRRMSSPWK